MREAIAVALGLALLVGAAGPAAANLNHLAVDSQTTDDAVLVELVYTASDGPWHVVVHADDGGEPGEPVGHRTVESGLETDFDVPLDESYWSGVEGNGTLWVALHRDDGDGEFDPGSDPVFTNQFDQRRAQRIVVGKRAGRTSVAAERFSPQSTDDTRVTVRRVELASPGSVVLRAVGENESLGSRVGETELSAGVSRNVTVALDESFVAAQDESFTLAAVATRSGTPVRVGSELVSTRFAVQRNDSDGTPRKTASETTTEPTDDGHDQEHEDGDHEHGTDDAPATTATTGAGFGVVAALLALVAALLWTRKG